MGVVVRPGSQLFSPVVELHALRKRLQNAPSAIAKFAILLAELEQRKHFRPLHPAVQCLLAGGTTAETGFSRRWLSQLFKQQIGVSPKAYARLQRFQRIVQLVAAGHRIAWADVAAVFVASHRPHANHVVVPGSLPISTRPPSPAPGKIER